MLVTIDGEVLARLGTRTVDTNNIFNACKLIGFWPGEFDDLDVSNLEYFGSHGILQMPERLTQLAVFAETYPTEIIEALTKIQADY